MSKGQGVVIVNYVDEKISKSSLSNVPITKT